MPPIKVSKQKLVNKAGKKKQPTPVASNSDGITDDEGEPSLCVFMANMGIMLNNLTTRIEGLEKKKDTEGDTTSSHLLYTSRPEISTSPAATSCPPARQAPAELHTYPAMSEEVRA